MTYDDLSHYRGEVGEPTTTKFYGYDVYKTGPWSQGPALLEALNRRRVLQGRGLPIPDLRPIQIATDTIMVVEVQFAGDAGNRIRLAQGVRT